MLSKFEVTVLTSESPYITHRDVLLNGKYGTAYRLQEFLPYQLNCCRYSFDIKEHQGGFDSVHLQIYKEMKQWYWDNGPDSEGFRDLAETIEARKLSEAKTLRDSLMRLRNMRPDEYPHEPGEDQLKAYKSDIALHEMHYRRYVEQGYLDECIR